MGVANLLSGRDESGERSTDDEFEEAKEGRTVDVDQEIDNAFHDGQGQGESVPGTVKRCIDGICDLLVGCKGHVPGKVGSGGSGSFCGFAAGEKVFLGARDGTLGRITRGLESEDDKEERKDGISDPSQREEMG